MATPATSSSATARSRAEPWLNGGPKALINGMLNSGGQLGRYVFNVVNAPPTGATLTGEVQEPEFNDPVDGAPVEICPTGRRPVPVALHELERDLHGRQPAGRQLQRHGAFGAERP